MPASLPLPTPRPSATLLLLREHSGRLEVLLQRRAATLTFGDHWVYPGGVVEPRDGDFAREPLAALRRAAVRECLEEAGVRLQAVTDGEGLIGWSRWITPEGRGRRFDTWFFAAALPPGQVVVGDACETTESRWLEPQAAIEAAAGGHMLLMPPTRLTLLDLQISYARHGSLVRLFEVERSRPIVPILPRLSGPAEARISVYPWDPEYDSLPGEGWPLSAPPPEHLRRLPSRLALGAGAATPRSARPRPGRS
ncbi:MAG: NUDIX domain-containing protein [Steroidobacteraceae bacterium]|nr:NUDIX domain-containing protein [Nevskiaceae bacterium]MCP5466334.1 NUDIX domain-containing protein [Nevskiaceae bacterium]